MPKITREAVLENLEEVRKYIAEEDSIKEEKKVCIEIKNRFTGAVKFTSEKTTIKEACQDNRANLREANLYGADLLEADLLEADLLEADLRGADLCDADLSGANLCGADLCDADLSGANLCGANLCGVKFYGKGGTTKIKKSQVDDFFKALGIVAEE